MIILAAIILSLTGNNVVDRTEEAVDVSNLKQVEELAQMAWADAYIVGKRSQTELETEVLATLKSNKVDIVKYKVTVSVNNIEKINMVIILIYHIYVN